MGILKCSLVRGVGYGTLEIRRVMVLSMIVHAVVHHAVVVNDDW